MSTNGRRVRDVGDRGAVGDDGVGGGDVGVIEAGAFHPRVVNLEARAVRQLAEVDVGADLVGGDGKVRRVGLTGEDRAQVSAFRWRA